MWQRQGVSAGATMVTLCLLAAAVVPWQTEAVPVRHKRDHHHRTPCKQMEINSRLAIRLRRRVTELRNSIAVDPDDQDLPTLFPSISQSFEERENITNEGRLQWMEDQLLMFRELMMLSKADGGWEAEQGRDLQTIIDDTGGMTRAVRVAATMLGIRLRQSNSTPSGPIPTADPNMDTDVVHYLLIRDFERLMTDVHRQFNRLVRWTCDTQ